MCVDASENRLGFSSPDAAFQFTLPVAKSKAAIELGINEDTNIATKELLAIYHAVLVAPRNICVRVFSDSQAAAAFTLMARGENDMTSKLA